MSTPSLWSSMFNKRPVIKRRDSTASSMTSASKDTIKPASNKTTTEDQARPGPGPGASITSNPAGGSYRLKTFDSNTDIEEPVIPKQKKSIISLFGSRKRTSIVSIEDDEDLGSMPSLSSSASFSSSSSSSSEDFLPLPIERLSSYKHHFTIRGQAINERTSFDSFDSPSPRKMHFWERNPVPAVLNMVEEPEFDDVVDWSAENQNNVYLGRV